MLELEPCGRIISIGGVIILGGVGGLVLMRLLSVARVWWLWKGGFGKEGGLRW
jgi:hypothetical protein